MGLGTLGLDRNLGQEKMNESNLIDRHGSMMEEGYLNGLVVSPINFQGVNKGEQNSEDFRNKMLSRKEVCNLDEILTRDHVGVVIQWLTKGSRTKKKKRKGGTSKR